MCGMVTRQHSYLCEKEAGIELFSGILNSWTISKYVMVLVSVT